MLLTECDGAFSGVMLLIGAGRTSCLYKLNGEVSLSLSL